MRWPAAMSYGMVSAVKINPHVVRPLDVTDA